MANVDTRQRIVEQALSLFASKGFSGTSVKDIADAVGIKDSSLYKHFASKREIFDSIVTQMSDRIGTLGYRLGPPLSQESVGNGPIPVCITEDRLVEISCAALRFYLEDPPTVSFRRMLVIEQYSDPLAGDCYRSLFLDGSISYLTGLFETLIKQKVMVEGDPCVMAVGYFAPFYFLLDRCRSQEDHANTLKQFEMQVRQFARHNLNR
ncbi:MAG: TetR/AcrR family transcriptional regulator [Bifidobacterium psychraerophilum]